MKTQLGRRRLRMTDDQWRRLAVKSKELGCKLLAEVATLVAPDTILRWHRRLVVLKWNFAERRKKSGRPPIDKQLAELVVRFATENGSLVTMAMR